MRKEVTNRGRDRRVDRPDISRPSQEELAFGGFLVGVMAGAVISLLLTIVTRRPAQEV